MAIAPYFVISPSALVSLFGLIRGARHVPEHSFPDWRELTVDVIIPAKNEESRIALCLASLFRQTMPPRSVTLIDDHSSDRTVEVAHAFCEANGVTIRIVRRGQSRGKTEGVRKEAEENNADVEFVLDADTVLDSDNYIERLVEELYRVPGIATACGEIHPLRIADIRRFANEDSVARLKNHVEGLDLAAERKGWRALAHGISNLYRDVLYYFVQNIIYRGDLAIFGSIPNPVGCAVAYRREYLAQTIHDVLLKHGDNLTTSEDIFFGLSFIYHGFRNIQVTDVIVRSEEPEIQVVPKQLLLWSSAWLQSAYYLPRLLASPALTVKRNIQHREHENPESNRRVIDDPYRWPWGEEYSNTAGRGFGWVFFLALFEKVSFPVILILMLALGWWEALAVTLGGEILVFSFFVAVFGPRQKISYFFKGILTAPLRYASLMFDLIVVLRFLFDITLGGRTAWKK